MAFSISWNEAYPAGSDAASGIDTYIQQDKIAVRERLESFMGISDFATRDPMSADAVKMDGGANTFILGGTASWGVKNQAGTNYNLQTTNAGVLTIRAGLIITAGGATVTAGGLTVTAGGATITAGGLTITAGGATVTAGDLDVMAGQGRIETYAIGNSGAAETVSWANGNIQTLTLDANCSVTLSNPKEGASYALYLTQDGSGSRIVTWVTTIRWSGAVTPTLTTTGGRTDLIVLNYVGGRYVGILAATNFQ